MATCIRQPERRRTLDPRSRRRDTAPQAHMLSGAQNMSFTNATLNNVAGNMTVVENHYINQRNPTDELVEVIDWLTPINFRVTQIDTLSRSTAGTGSWFIECDEFREWTSKDSSILWGTGMPGAGKTILSAIIIDHLQKQFPPSQNIAVTFAYCRYTDQYSAKDILSSLLKQLLERHSWALQYVKATYDLHKMERTRPSQEELLGLLQKILISLDKTFVVIDALDEVSDDAKYHLITSLSSLQANILLTSRALDLFKDLVPSAVHWYIEAKNDDVGRFIAERIKQIPRLKQVLKGKVSIEEEIVVKIQQKSGGMFLLAALQVEVLKSSISVKSLRKAIEVLPSGVNDMYQATLGRIQAQDEEAASLAMRAILWLTYANQSLTIAELRHSLAIPDDEELFDEDDVLQEDTIVSACWGLITIDGESQVVRLVHYTAQEYFQNIKSGLFSRPHSFLATKCVAYLSMFHFQEQHVPDPALFNVFLDSGVFVRYAYFHWGFHAQACYKEDGLPQTVIDFVLGCPQYYANDDPDQYPVSFDIFNPFHVAAIYNLHSLFVLPEITSNTKVSQMYKWTALQAAVKYGEDATVELILEAMDADRNQRDGVLRMKIDIDSRDKYGETALITAAREGRTEIVILLLAHGADANAKSEDGFGTALIAACYHGHLGPAEALLSHPDVEVNIINDAGQTALTAACIGFDGHPAVVKLLLSHHAVQVNATDGKGDTALIAACRKGNRAVVEYLLSHPDLDVNAREGGELGRTALIVACRKGHGAVVEALLSHPEVDVNARDREGKTALIAASSKGSPECEEVVKILLSYRQGGVDANSRDSPGGAVLPPACRRPEVDTDAKGDDGCTALMVAFRHGDKSIVELLLSSGSHGLACADGLSGKVGGVGAILVPDTTQSCEAVAAPMTTCRVKGDKEVVRLMLVWASLHDHSTLQGLLLAYWNHFGGQLIEPFFSSSLDEAISCDSNSSLWSFSSSDDDDSIMSDSSLSS